MHGFYQALFMGKKNNSYPELLLLYPFIMSGGPVMHSICNNDLVFHEALTFWLKERLRVERLSEGKLSGYLYLNCPCGGLIAH